MNTTRAKVRIAVGAVVTLGLLGCAAYLFEIPPFDEQVGEIAESAVCESLGPSSKSVTALKSVLPEASSYAFDDDVTLRVDEQDDGFTSDCFVSGGGKEVMSARTQMMRADSAQNWVSGEVEQYVEDSSQLTSFDAGAKGVASSSVAAVFVPCTSAGKIPGGQYNLSVVVQLKESKGASTAQTRSGLIELAKSAASYAHAQAKCDMPSTVG
ncbi:hypothetical protein [Streptomyces sp. PSKA30]|uniref:hypothetical protein n=1 Tax=Streptomyces sp. PSKA30 TaxID=2874597 RepID=UPI001CD0F8DA|nr:hypothetical protein [Streptomyces sp. PSKA30]MBZ9638495.1 hypothetical protein [Streptomyces sp. PSKA30]